MPDVRNGDQDQQGRDPDGRENVKHFGPLFVDQNENDRRQTKNPKVREPSSSLCLVRLHSLTHTLLVPARVETRERLAMRQPFSC